MRKIIFIVTCLFVVQTNVFAQLNGTYTIGGASPNYATFTAAINALVTNGVSGPVTFNVRNGTYTEQLSISAVAGVSAVNEVIFQSENLDSTLVTLTYNATTLANPHTLKFNGGQYITFRKM